jgi:mannose-6-phosphate isomerase-like protein (cupin superfamily)
MHYERGPGRYVRRFADVPLPAGEPGNDCLAMFESATFIRSFVPAGQAGRGFHTHEVDQLYFILDGELEVVIGGTALTGHEHELIVIPAGLPHRNFNRGTVDELHLEIILPTPAPWPAWTRDAEQSSVPAPPNLVRREDLGQTIAYERHRGYRSNILADRSSGFDSGHLRIDRLDPGASGPGLHIHRFDQFYFVLEGTLSVEVAGERHDVHPHELAVLTAGAPHRQWNESSSTVKWLTMNLPEPEPGTRWDAPVDSFTGDFSYTPRADEPMPHLGRS